MATPGMDEGLLIPIQFSLEEARAALAQLEAQARAAGVRIGDGVSGGASKGLADLKTQMGRGRESAMFFTQALGEFGPQGRTAQIALAGVAGAIMGGGGVLAALSLAQAGARLLVDAWNESSERAKKAAADAKQAADDIAEAIKDARERVQAATFQLSNTPESEQFRRKTLEQAKATLADVEFEVLESNRRRKAALAQGNADEAAAWAARMSAAQARLPGLRELATLAGKQYDRLLGMEEVGEAKKKWDAIDEAAKERTKELAAWALRAEEDNARALYALELANAKDVDGALKARADAFNDYVNRLFGGIQAKFDEGVKLPQGMPKSEIEAARDSVAADRIRKESLQDLQAVGVGAYQSLARASAAAFGPMLTGSRAYASAMRAAGGAAQTSADLSAAAFASMLQGVLASIAQESAVKSLFQVAEGLAALATPGMQASAGAHFAAAAKYAVVAGVAGLGAVGIGATRGMTAAEQADVNAARQGNAAGSTGTTSGGSREFGGGAGGSAGTVHTRELIVVIGDPFETAAETARRAARRLGLAAELNMMPARSA